MPKLRTIAPKVKAMDTSTTRLPPRQKDAYYGSAAHRAWAAAVIARSGRRCEHVNGYGVRCERAYPESRLFADHIREFKDQGARLDPANGMCLCSEHHTRKTNQARAERWK